MKFLSFIFILSACFLNISAQTGIEIKTVVASSDLLYNKPVTRSEEGMPIGNGRMGTLIWTTPSSLKLQLNRVDIFGNNAASNSFFERNTDYCSGAGFVDIDMISWGDDIFTAPAFSQHLSCYDGIVTTSGKGIKTTAVVWNEQDVMAVKIEDLRGDPQPIVVNLRMLRDTIVKKSGHTASSTLGISGNKIFLTQKFTEENYYCGSGIIVAAAGRDTKIRKANDTEMQLILKAGKEPVVIYISTSASFDKNQDLLKASQKQLESAINTGFDNIISSNRKWWQSFWDRSYVKLHSNDGEADFIQVNYNYFMYVMASSSLGSYPPKFNGMIWSTAGDSRKWGNNYWGANQSCMYNGLFPANRMELMEPMFRMYSAMAPSLEIAARQQWDSKGIYIPETVSFDGLPELPEEIASEMSDLYLLRKPWTEKSEAFDDYASTKSPFQSRWNWKQDKGWVNGKWTFTDKGAGTFGHVSHIFSRGAKLAYQYWQKYEFTKDIQWLKSVGYPIIKGVAEFYRNFPNLRKEADGKYHLYNINDNESVRGGHNTVEEISSMMGILPAAIRASELLGTDAELTSLWSELLSNLSPLPFNTNYSDTYKQGAPVTFVRSLPPVVQGPGTGRPDQNTMPVWFFDLCNPVAGNTEMVKIANATYDSYFPEGISKESRVFVLSKLAVAGTMMGRKDATRFLIPNQIRTAEIETMPNRMTLREGYQTTGVQNLGRMADALHYALLNSSPPKPAGEPVISLFHAWPEDWEADFKLLARGNFLIESSFRNGKVTKVEILSQNGSDCAVINPWEGQTVIINRNNKNAGRQNGNILNFKTKTGEMIKLSPVKR